MTFGKINETFRGPEAAESNPQERLAGMLALIRSVADQKPITARDLAASLTQFEVTYGPPSTDSVDRFLEAFVGLMDIDVPEAAIDEILSAVSRAPSPFRERARTVRGAP